MPAAKILIVEDESIVVMDLRHSLENLGYTVVGHASRGEEAIRKAAALHPNLVLMDIHLKGEMDGIEAANQIRTTLDLPVIFLTAHADADTLRRAQRSEPFGYIIKPFEEQELESNIAIALYKHVIEQQLRQSELKYRSLFETMAHGIVYLDCHGAVTNANPAAESILGLTLEQMQLQGQKSADWQAIHEDGSAFLEGEYPDTIVLHTQQIVSNVVMGITHPLSKGTTWLSVHARPEKVSGEEAPCQVVVTFEDITAIKRAELELRKLSQAVEQSANAVVITDSEGAIEYVNPKFSQTTGYTLEEVRGMNPRILKSGNQTSEFYEILWKTIKSGQAWKGEFYNKTKNGTFYWEDATIAPIVNPQGTITHFIGVKEDITSRKAFEAAEREQRLLAEALLDTASALNSTLELNAVLDRILENVGRVVPSDTVILMLWEDDKLRVVGQRGFTERGLGEYLAHAEFTLQSLKTFQEMSLTFQPKIIPDVSTDPDWIVPVPQLKWVRSYLGAPILIRGKIAGFLNLDSAEPNFFTNTHAVRLQAFANQVSSAIDNAQLYDQTRLLSITDGLTGLFNARHFFELAEVEFSRARRYDRPLSMIMLDADHFKAVNDGFGHQVGDAVLRDIAQHILQTVRKIDVCARYGGEEFIIMLPETQSIAAFQVAERVRLAVFESAYSGSGSISVPVTVSLGVACLNPQQEDLNALIQDADRALYASKANGRNCVTIWEGNQAAEE